MQDLGETGLVAAVFSLLSAEDKYLIGARTRLDHPDPVASHAAPVRSTVLAVGTDQEETLNLVWKLFRGRLQDGPDDRRSIELRDLPLIEGTFTNVANIDWLNGAHERPVALFAPVYLDAKEGRLRMQVAIEFAKGRGVFRGILRLTVGGDQTGSRLILQVEDSGICARCVFDALPWALERDIVLTDPVKNRVWMDGPAESLRGQYRDASGPHAYVINWVLERGAVERGAGAVEEPIEKLLEHHS